MAQATGSGSSQRFLSIEEERNLIWKWQNGSDENSLRELLYAFRPFMARMARSYSNSPETQDDLINDGYIAMIETLDRFKPQDETRFISYARSFVRAAMIARVHQLESTIDIPRDKLLAARKGQMNDQKAELIQAMSRKISLDESPEHNPIENDICAVEILSRKQTISSWRENLELAFSGLNDEEREIMAYRLRSGDAKAKDIAEGLGKTPSRIRAVEARAMIRLKSTLISQGFTASSLVNL